MTQGNQTKQQQQADLDQAVEKQLDHLHHQGHTGQYQKQEKKKSPNSIMRYPLWVRIIMVFMVIVVLGGIFVSLAGPIMQLMNR